MLDFSSPLGQKILARLEQEQVIWLTTVDAHNAPQPRPVWFYWDGEAVLIFSQPQAAKVRHIPRNPHVALNFNSTAEGDEVAVLTGEAHLSNDPVSPKRLAGYLKKYAEGIKNIGLTPESMQAEYSVVILVTPKSLRGF